MSILLPENENSENEPDFKINYQPTDCDEECFFLLYHLSVQPSEAKALDSEHRKWMIARFMAQKEMEQEAVARHQIMNQIAPNLKNFK
jgi:hypothetical protein